MLLAQDNGNNAGKKSKRLWLVILGSRETWSPQFHPVVVGYCLTWSRRVKVAKRKDQSPCLAGAPFASDIEKTLLTLIGLYIKRNATLLDASDKTCVQISPLRPYSVRCPICSPRNFPLHSLEISFFGCGTSRIEATKRNWLMHKERRPRERLWSPVSSIRSNHIPWENRLERI